MIKKLGEYKNRPIVSGNNRNHKSELTEKQLVELLGGNTSGGVTINNQEKSVDITENGTTEVVADAGFTGLSKVVVNTNVTSIGGGSGWTGHADAEGLRAIGWTDEDIAYYQTNGVNWNEEDDQYHLVSDDNKALYGVLTADNISTYASRIVYLPKIDTSGKTYMGTMYASGFPGCVSMIAVPQLDTSKMTSMQNMFYGCRSLHCVPELDTKNVTNMNYMFRDCHSLVSAPLLNTKNVTNMSDLFYSCKNLRYVPLLDCENATNISNMLSSCQDLSYFKVKNLKLSCNLRESTYLFSKDSLLYLINNEAATSAITITLATYTYTRLANDPDIVAALANHPNISIAQ